MKNIAHRSQDFVICPTGSLDRANAMRFQRQLHAAIVAEHTNTLLIDMTQVEAIDSCGLMALMSGVKMARKHGKQLRLCGVSLSIRMVLELTQIDRVLDILDQPPGQSFAAA